MDLLEEIESVLTDAGGPGEFKYDGGPKPYVKKDGTTSKKSQDRVDSVNEGQQQTIPVPTEEQQKQAAALVQKYFDEKSEFEIFKQTERDKELSNHDYRLEGIKNQIEGGEFDQDASERRSIVSWLGKFNTDGPITREEDDALQEFVAGGVTENQIQGYLITGKNPRTDSHALTNEQIETHSEILSNMTDRWSANKNLKLYRGLTAEENEPHKKEFIESILNSEPGDVLHNQAFSSFSFSKDAAGGYGHPSRGGLTLQLNLNKGQYGVPVNDVFVTHNSTNREVVIDKNSKFKVESVDKANRHVVLSLHDKDPATDSLAIDYTFIPEEHPRQKDPDWGGKPQEPGQSKAPLNTVVPTPEAHAAAQELVKKYYDFKNKKGLDPDLNWDVAGQDIATHPEYQERLAKFVSEKSKVYDDLINEYETRAKSPKESETSEWLQSQAEHFKEQKAKNTSPEWSQEILRRDILQKQEAQRQKEAYETRKTAFKSGSGKLSKKDKVLLKEQKETTKQWARELAYGENDEFYPDESDMAYVLHDISKMNQIRPITQAHVDAIEAYQGSANMVQGYLALGSSSGRFESDDTHIYDQSDILHHVEALSDACKSYEASEDWKGYRGISSERFKGADKGTNEEQIAKNQKAVDFVNNFLEAKSGDIFHNPAFASVSHSREYAESFSNRKLHPESQVTLEVSIRKGQNGLDMNQGAIGDGDLLFQREVVLNKGQHYRIDHVDKENRLVKISLLNKNEVPKDAATDSVSLDSAPNWLYNSHQLQYVIESPKGTLRTGHGFQVRMPADYGYIVGFIGADGDEVDCYLGPNPWIQVVYVVDQNKLNSPIFDEHKCLIGFASEYEARRCYLSGHHMGDKIFRGIKALSMREFINWLQRGNLIQPITK